MAESGCVHGAPNVCLCHQPLYFCFSFTYTEVNRKYLNHLKSLGENIQPSRAFFEDYFTSKYSFSFGNSQKSEDTKSGEYGGCSTSSKQALAVEDFGSVDVKLSVLLYYLLIYNSVLFLFVK